MSKFKLIVFDWDGTLIDSTGRIIDSMQRAATDHGMSPVTDAQVQQIIGLGLPEAIKALWPSITNPKLAEMIPSYANYFISDSPVAMAPFDGCSELLDSLQEQGYLVAVATGKARKGLNRTMVDLKLGHYFAATRCADETQSKPNPQMLFELMEELKIKAEQTLMVGDTTYDLEMANAAGVASIGMTHGAHQLNQLQACKPLVLCHSMHELQRWITNHG